MSTDRNLCVFSGWLKRVEMRYSKAGKPYTRCAMNVGAKNSPCWIDMVAFDELAERTNALGEGAKVQIEAYVKQDKWVDQATGQNRYRLSFVITHIDGQAADRPPEPQAPPVEHDRSRGTEPERHDPPPARPPGDAIPF